MKTVCAIMLLAATFVAIPSAHGLPTKAELDRLERQLRAGEPEAQPSLQLLDSEYHLLDSSGLLDKKDKKAWARVKKLLQSSPEKGSRSPAPSAHTGPVLESPTVEGLLGAKYIEGDGLERDLAEGVRWLRRAAEHGDLTAIDAVGLAYVNGEGIPRDLKEALRWFRKGALGGYAASQANLGRMLAQGLGTARDDVEGCLWYTLASGQGHDAARQDLATVKAHMRPAQRQECEGRAAAQPRPPLDPVKAAKVKIDAGDAKGAVAILEPAAGNGYAPACVVLSDLYQKGVGVQADQMAAYKWLALAAVQGNDLGAMDKLKELRSSMTPAVREKAMRASNEAFRKMPPDFKEAVAIIRKGERAKEDAPLSERLVSKDLNIRSKASDEFKKLPPKKQVELIPDIERGLRAPDFGVRQWSIALLQMMTGLAKPAVPALREVARKDADYNIRRFAQDAITNITKYRRSSPQ
ncbi:tetratricopeptide repeat protein, partial [Elusimicrobiota bacterium]